MAHTTAWRKTFFHTGKKKDFFSPVSDEGTAGQVRWRKKKKNGKKVFFPRDVIKSSPEGEKLEPKCRYKRALLLAGARHRRLTEMERKKNKFVFYPPRPAVSTGITRINWPLRISYAGKSRPANHPKEPRFFFPETTIWLRPDFLLFTTFSPFPG